MQAASPAVSRSPSLTRTNLSEIAARVVEEFIADNETDSEFSFNENDKYENYENQANEEDNDDDFEFAFVTEGSHQFSPISADEIFYNGQIRPIFEFKCGCKSDNVSNPTKSKSIRVSLGKLFIEDREIASSSSFSSSEVDDLEGIAPGTYCVWRPKAAESPSELRKKSNSTGSTSSKPWKLRDFLHRSNSEGKETFVFLTKRKEKAESNITGKVTGVKGFPAVRL